MRYVTVEVRKQTGQLPLGVRLSRKFGELMLKPYGWHDLYYDLEGLKTACVRQFDLAKKNIRIVEERFNATVYGNEQVIGSLKGAIARGATVELVSGPSPDPKSELLWALVKDGMATHYQLKKVPPTHFTLVDDKHIRIEYPHSPTEDNWREGYFTESHSLGASLWERFEELKSKSQAVSEV